MPSWNRLRLDRQSEKDAKRRAPTEPDSKQDVEPQEEASTEQASGTVTPTSPRRNRRVRDSVVSLSAVKDPPRQMDSSSPTVPSLELPQESPHAKGQRTNRFSLMKFRHASDSQLSKTAKEHADMAPPIPAPPSIITTAPTTENFEVYKRRSAFLHPRKNKTLNQKKSKGSFQDVTGDEDATTPTSRVTFDEGARLRMTQSGPIPPPAYGDESSSALALPISRMSESSRSDGSSGDHGVFATTTTTHTVSTTTTFFRLPRRRKNKGPLFPLPPKVNSSLSAGNTPRMSTSGRDSESPSRSHFGYPSEGSSVHGSPRRSGQHSPSRGGSFFPDNVDKSDSRASSIRGRPSALGERGRSSTMSSLRNAVEDIDAPVPPIPQSTRTSTSTAGRPSLGGLFNLSRLRQTPESSSRLAPTNPGTPGSMDSKQNSIHLHREPEVVIPEKQEGDTPAKYLARLEEVLNRSALVSILTKNDDEFSRNVLRSYMRRFKFYEDPLDMAVRKMLMHVELPKETGQIDKTLQSFADRYHECNPGIFPSPDDAYFVAFSILILHTDVFNKNNKNKMQKPDYVKNTRSQGGTITEVLECFYDNISYTPFIHVEDDLDMTHEVVAQKTAKRSGLKSSSTPSLKRHNNGPIDPYTLLMDGKLDSLRPDLDDVLPMEDSFNYLYSGIPINVKELNRTFYRTGVIQILSSRSRPGAFANQATISNPAEAQVGVVDMKITKVGLLWRKDPKKKKTRSPWQEWGAILTGSQLYFFRNTSWCKNLIHQYDQHQKNGRLGTPVIFKPPLEQFKPDFILSIEDAVALVDSQYKKHKNAFVFTRQNNFAEVFLADNDSELKDWLAKLNYAATYRTSGVRMKGVVGNSYESYKHRDAQRSLSNTSDQAPNSENGDQDIEWNRHDEEFSSQVMEARRQIMSQRISQGYEKIQELDQQLDAMMRAGRQLKILAPIQTRTRQDVRDAAVRVATHIRVTQMERWRAVCHRDILELDLEEDRKFMDSKRSNNFEAKNDETIPLTTKESQSRSPFSRLGSKHGDSKSNSSKTRPSTQKLFSMDEIFRTPSRLKSQSQGHKPKGSWELPPLNFDRRASDTSKPEPAPSEEQAVDSSDDDTPFLTVPNTPMGGTRNSSEIDVSKEHAEEDEKERDLLAEAGVIPPDAEAIDGAQSDELAADSKKEDTEDKDGLSKVRHSLQKKLQNTHVPSHHRSKKGKDSNSSAGVVDENSVTTENEQLTRSKGSFTVHGKKASIVTFGSEWQNMTPEERMKRSRPQSGTVRLPSSIDGVGQLQTEITAEEIRPSTPGTSSEVATVRSIGSGRRGDRKQSDASNNLANA